jgi:type I restriction enzyme S subunit
LYLTSSAFCFLIFSSYDSGSNSFDSSFDEFFIDSLLVVFIFSKSDNSNLLDKYLFYLSNRDQFWQIRGQAQPFISLGDVKKTKVTLPPLPEQKRIVNLISSVDSYIEILQQQLEGAKKSRNAVLHELLNAGGDDWLATTLGEVAQLNPEQARDYATDRLIKYIDLSTVNFDTGIDSEISSIPFKEAPGRARRVVRKDDILISTVRPYLRGFAVVGEDFDGEVASTGFCVLRAKTELILPELAWAIVSSNDFVDFLIRCSTGSNYPAVRPNDISEFSLRLPPLSKQIKISELVRAFDQTISQSIESINSVKNLRSGLLSDLLSGEHEIPASYDKVIGVLK